MCHKDLMRYDQKKFCSRSCSVKYNNSLRKCKESSNKKRSKTLKKIHKENYTPYTKVYFKYCEGCNNDFIGLNPWRASCSDKCLKKIQSDKRIKYLKEHAGTFNWIPNGKANYFEQSFIDWLISIGYEEDKDFIALKYSVHNNELNTTYFLDIYFPNINLNIELDGTHHEKPYYVDRDTNRDDFLSRIHKMTIYRISIRDYNRRGGRKIVFNDTFKLLKKLDPLSRIGLLSAS